MRKILGVIPVRTDQPQGMPATIYAVMMLCRMPRGMRKSVPSEIQVPIPSMLPRMAQTKKRMTLSRVSFWT
ncbi:hypothetical protein [uncultured Intestinimonas sp.]|uniref:hypothetical protein n=1 Tax=uncultured Intestinimonas sp. TaxID=1689265 RepID=UPI002628738C|nr:hypothetical protein [uncultured Intestinimonas sp.]